MKTGWTKLPFEEVIADVSGGNVKTPQGEFISEGRFAIVDQGKELVSGYVNEEKRLCHADLPVIVFGDHTRCFKYVDFPFCMGADGVKVLRPKVEAEVKYLYYYLRQLRITDDGYSRHFKYLKRHDVILPPLEEQKRIANILDRAEALRAKRRAALAQLDELKQSIFIDMFGDPLKNPKKLEVIKLDGISGIVSGVTKGRKLAGKSTIFVPYLRVANVQDGFLDLTEIKDIEVLPSDIEKYALQNGDILLTEGGDPDKLGRGAVWKGQILKCIHQNHIFRVRVNREYLVPEYLSMLIGSAYGKMYFLKSAKQTTGIASINSTQLKNFPVLIAPLDPQLKFANIVNQIEKITEYQQQSSLEINNLIDALMEKAFAGELV